MEVSVRVTNEVLLQIYLEFLLPVKVCKYLGGLNCDVVVGRYKGVL